MLPRPRKLEEAIRGIGRKNNQTSLPRGWLRRSAYSGSNRGADRHDVTRVENVLDGVVVTRLESTPESHRYLCADMAYDSSEARRAVEERGFVPHVLTCGEEKLE